MPTVGGGDKAWCRLWMQFLYTADLTKFHLQENKQC